MIMETGEFEEMNLVSTVVHCLDATDRDPEQDDHYSIHLTDHPIGTKEDYEKIAMVLQGLVEADINDSDFPYSTADGGDEI